MSHEADALRTQLEAVMRERDEAVVGQTQARQARDYAEARAAAMRAALDEIVTKSLTAVRAIDKVSSEAYDDRAQIDPDEIGEWLGMALYWLQQYDPSDAGRAVLEALRMAREALGEEWSKQEQEYSVIWVCNVCKIDEGNPHREGCLRVAFLAALDKLGVGT